MCPASKCKKHPVLHEFDVHVIIEAKSLVPNDCWKACDLSLLHHERIAAIHRRHVIVDGCYIDTRDRNLYRVLWPLVVQIYVLFGIAWPPSAHVSQPVAGRK